MIGGQIGRKLDFEFRLGWDITSTHTGDGTGYYSVQAHLDTTCTRSLNFTAFDEFTAGNKQYMILEGGSTDNPAGASTVASLEIPCWGISDTYSTGSATDALEIKVVFEGVSLYNFNQLGTLRWNLTCDAVEWFVGGVSQGRFTGLTNLLGTRLEPCGVPILGLPPLVSGSVAAHFGITVPPYTYDTQQEAGGPIYGGYRFKESGAGSWVEPDVQFAAHAYPSLSCSVGSGNADNVVTGTTTWDCQIDAYSKVREIGVVAFPPGGGTEDYFTRQETASREGWFSPIPVYARAVEREGYAPGEIIYRGGFPYTTIRTDRTCLTPATFPLGTSAESVAEVHPAYPEDYARIDAGTHVIEDPCFETVFSLRAAGVGENKGQWVSISDVPGEPTTGTITDINEYLGGYSAGTEFPYEVGGRTVGTDPNLDMMGYLDWYDISGWGNAHDQRVRYCIYWLHPHWSYFNTFEDWTVDGSAVGKEAYWIPLGHQWMGHTQVDPSERTLERTTLLSAPLMEGALQAYIEDMTEIGYKTSFWGIADFDVLPLTPIGTTTAQAGPTRYTLTDCTASYGSDIQLTSTGASLIKCKYDLTSFTQSPYMHPSIAQQFEVDWTATNITDCEVYLIGIDGAELLLTDTPGTFAWPLTGLSADQYAGTWDKDYGVGAVTDEGEDTDLVVGDSAAMMASVSRTISPGMLPGRTAKYIEFRITVTNTANPVNIDYPIFHAPTEQPLPLTLARQASAQVYEDGPGWLWGYTTHADPSTGVVNPPTVRDIGAQMTTLDVLAFRNLVLRGEAATFDISTDVASLYVASEEYNVDKNTAEDTIAFIAYGAGEPKFVLHNSYVTPPVWSFPAPKKQGSLEDVAGEYWMSPISFSERSRILVSDYRDTDPPHLHSDTGELWTAPFPVQPNGWAIEVHTHAVDNTETDFRVRRFAKDYALCRPFHGYFWIVNDPLASGLFIAADNGLDGMHYRAYGTGSGLLVGKADNALTWNEYDPSITAEAAAMAVEKGTARVFLFTVESGSVKEYTSTTGETYTLARTIASGSQVAATATLDNLRYIYWVDGSAIKGEVCDVADNVVRGPFTAVASGVDDAQIAVSASIAGGVQRIELHYISSGSITIVTSTDGQNFS